jgi:hypothetical protein
MDNMQLRLNMVNRGFPSQDLRESSAPERIDSDKPYLQSLGGWQLHRGNPDCSGRRLPHLENGLSAKYWLQSFRNDPFAIDAMRRALGAEAASVSLVRLRDEDVIEQVANLVKSGLWHVCEPVMRLYKVLLAQEPALMLVPRRGPAASPPPPQVSDVPDLPTLAGNADQVATARVLVDAGNGGEPFCEECAKAAAARMAANQV